MRRPLLVVLPLLALLGAARPAGAANVALFFRSGLRRHGDRRHGRGVQPAAGPHGLYYFFELMERGFFALLVFAGLVAFVREPAAAALAGRNEPCPCGSGRKFKRCHGR